ncbi:MAG: hypothetical protein L0Y75_08130 [Acidobacteria bacterium]|nr:hypothetical protein [Acidobacteriota bacterium]
MCPVSTRGVLATATLLSIMAFSSGKVESQNLRASAYSDEKASMDNNCELNIHRLHNINEIAGKDNLIIIIARLGSGERNKALNSRRLHNARAFLKEFLRRDEQAILVAEGEKVTGRGRLDFYIGGKLTDSLGMSANEDLYVGTCEWSEADKIFFDSRRPGNKSRKPRT